MKLKASLFGASAAALGILLTNILLFFRPYCIAVDVVENIVVGFLAGYSLYTYWKRRMLVTRLKRIADLNHRVRNALEIIAYLRVDSGQQSSMRDAIAMIEKALVEMDDIELASAH